MTDYIVRGLSHIALFTDNPERVANFYIENFGFRFYYENMTANGKFRVLSIEMGYLVLEIIGVAAIPEGGPIAHYAIEICGLEAFVAHMKEKGVIDADQQIVADTDIWPSGIKHLTITGPANEKIELYEMAQPFTGHS